MTMKTVVIADDHPVFRLGLAHIINASNRYTVTGEAETSHQLYARLQDRCCDIVILDMKMTENRDGMKALKRIKKVYPKVRVMIMSQMCSFELVQEAMNLGADGYVSKNDISEMILPFLACIDRGDKVLSPRVQSLLMDVDKGMVEKLTSRESDILRLSAEGLDRKDIACKLNISISTVNFHRQNIKQKLQAKTLTGMIHAAHEKGLVE